MAARDTADQKLQQIEEDLNALNQRIADDGAAATSADQVNPPDTPPG